MLQNVHLHEPVLGQEISFDATGSFRDIGDVQAASLQLQRTDDIAGHIDLAYTHDFAANTLKVDLDAAEDAGGLVSALAGLPQDVPVALTLNADGTPGDYKLAFDLAMTDYLQAQGTANLDYEGPIQISADISAQPGAEDAAGATRRSSASRPSWSSRPPRARTRLIQIETARLSSPYLRASASGTYSRATGAADLQVDLTAEPELAAPFEGVEFAGLTFNGTIQGQPGSLSANGDLKLDGFTTASAAVDQATLNIDVGQSGTAEQPTTNLSVQGNVQGLRLDQIPADVIGDARLTVDASMTGSEVTLQTAEIDSQALNVSASGTANTETGDFDVSYQASAPQIGPVLEPYGVEAQGHDRRPGPGRQRGGVLGLQTSADLTDLQYPQLADAERLHLEANAVQYAERTTFDVTGTGQALRIDQLGPDLLNQRRLRGQRHPRGHHADARPGPADLAGAGGDRAKAGPDRRHRRRAALRHPLAADRPRRAGLWRRRPGQRQRDRHRPARARRRDADDRRQPDRLPQRVRRCRPAEPAGHGRPAGRAHHLRPDRQRRAAAHRPDRPRPARPGRLRRKGRARRPAADARPGAADLAAAQRLGRGLAEPRDDRGAASATTSTRSPSALSPRSTRSRSPAPPRPRAWST